MYTLASMCDITTAMCDAIDGMKYMYMCTDPLPPGRGPRAPNMVPPGYGYGTLIHDFCMYFLLNLFGFELASRWLPAGFPFRPSWVQSLFRNACSKHIIKMPFDDHLLKLVKLYDLRRPCQDGPEV